MVDIIRFKIVRDHGLRVIRARVKSENEELLDYIAERLTKMGYDVRYEKCRKRFVLVVDVVRMTFHDELFEDEKECEFIEKVYDIIDDYKKLKEGECCGKVS